MKHYGGRTFKYVSHETLLFFLFHGIMYLTLGGLFLSAITEYHGG